MSGMFEEPGEDFYISNYPAREIKYELIVPAGGWRRKFNKEYINVLRPIAETLAMLDKAWPSDYMAYLQEADAVVRYRNHTDELSWVRRDKLMRSDAQTSELWSKLQMLLILKEKDDEKHS